ncbi:MAG: glycogen debranching protein [Saprospiraceae bacterium]|nr:glycogen debranching protein [Saprospiraceae bacterium]
MNTDILYSSEAFTLYNHKIVQGNNVAVVHSPTHITSNYKSPASDHFSRLITFKLSVNEKDNELPVGVDHQVIVNEEKESPVILFGSVPDKITDKPETFLPPNYSYTFKVDMSPVIKQFEEKGYFEAYDGTRVARSDFKGFYIAGGSAPLSWDFVGLDEKGLKLVDSGKDNIYTITLVLNPYDAKGGEENTWQKTWDTTDKPQYSSDQPIVDVLYNLTLEEAKRNIELDGILRTGVKWGGVWTRDIFYSIFLAFAYYEPEIAKNSLMKKVSRQRIIQDTGSGGAWPISSDRTTWVLATWEIYKVTGDLDWLRQSYIVIKNTLDDDAKTIGMTRSGMNRGESSFLDWREQTYPKWMDNKDIYMSENLGTNVVHFQANMILSQMASILGEASDSYLQKAQKIKSSINQQLWMEDKGYYAQYLYGRKNLIRSPRFEALGEALAVLFDVADTGQSKAIFEKSPLTSYGVSCIYPQIPGIPPYHNNAVWPFVQSYWNLAAAKAGNENALNHGLAAIYRAGGLFLTNYENFVAQSGDFKGTEINSDRMLWSMAGNLAMVHRLFIGMSFEPQGLRFQPVIPKIYDGNKNLTGFKYRNATLDIKVRGFGNKISSIKMDGKELSDNFLPGDLKGYHTIDITMNNLPFNKAPIQVVENVFSPLNPLTRLIDDNLTWDPVKAAVAYKVYKNGSLVAVIKNTSYLILESETAEYSVSAVDSHDWESFMSEPILVASDDKIQLFQMEDIAEKAALPYSNFQGNGFVEISNDKNRKITINVQVTKAGRYLADFRYANGSGPWNTDNKCAIRSMYVNNSYHGVIVMPQRGQNEWSEWGWSNLCELELKTGKNEITVMFEPWNINMNGEVNTAMLDYMRLINVD